MRKIQDSNISLRISKNLKNRLTDFSLQYELHSSSVIRQALLWYLQRHMQVERARAISSMPASMVDEGRPNAWLAAGK